MVGLGVILPGSEYIIVVIIILIEGAPPSPSLARVWPLEPLRVNLTASIAQTRLLSSLILGVGHLDTSIFPPSSPAASYCCGHKAELPPSQILLLIAPASSSPHPVGIINFTVMIVLPLPCT